MYNSYLWTEKYRPSTIGDYIFSNPTHKQIFTTLINQRTIPNLLFSGIQGSGKSSLAQILISAIGIDESDVLTINASDLRGIDVFRDTIKEFASTTPLGLFKVVCLEEAERLTAHAQTALKKFMEDVSDSVRFILTTNHENEIIGPIKSRCQQFRFGAADINDITERAIIILTSENIKFDLQTLDEYVTKSYPDIRKLINLLQQYSTTGTLESYDAGDNTADVYLAILATLDKGNWSAAREIVCDEVSDDQWDDLYRYLYQNIHNVPKYQHTDMYERAIVLIAEYLYKHSIVADPEINFTALLIQLSQL